MEGLLLHLYHPQNFSLRAVYRWRFLFLVLTICIPCLASSSQACPEAFKCGNHSFEYPFGRKNSGCGNPALQLDCDHRVNMSAINISGYQYYLLAPSDHQKGVPINHMKIIDRNMWGPGDTCYPSTSNHTMEFWSSTQFRFSDDYMNISLWGECTEHMPTEAHALQCNKNWYCSSSSDLNLGTYCKSLVHLPVRKFDRGDLSVPKFDRGNLSVPKFDRGNRTCLDRITHGFEINWNFSEGCEDCGPRKEASIALGSSMGGVALIAALAVLCILNVKRRKRAYTRKLGGDYSNYQGGDIEAGHVTYMIGSLTIFPYQELQQATNFFDEKNELGGGGFGVVYLGKLVDGRAVAVKRLYQESSRTVEQFINEVQILSSLCHPNLVRLYGCTCPQSPMLLLVYDFVSNGTLYDHLHGSRRTSRGLPWAARLNIAIETAQALAYLHNIDPPIFHRDVKSSNILLDEHFRAKVADFGLSRLVPVNVSHVTTAPQGTPGYVDPEYHECFQLTEKSDVYSLGVVLVEIISAKVAVDVMRSRSEIKLANMATDKIRRGLLDELVDRDLNLERNHEVEVTVAAVAELAFECLAIERDLRPTMKEVVARLTDIKEMLQESTESSSSTSNTPTSSLTSPLEN